MRVFLIIAMAAGFVLCAIAETSAQTCAQKCARYCEHQQPNYMSRCSFKCTQRGH